MNATLAIAKREFRSYFDSPLAYVVVCLGLLFVGVWVFVGPGRFWQVDRASLGSMFDALPMGLLLIVAVITMRLLAEEKRSGTLEMLITLPVRDSDVILGKYLGALGLIVALLASTLLYPLLMFKSVWHLGPIDMGPVWSGYLGLLLFSAAIVAIGLLVSSLTESQVIAFFITIVAMVFFYWIGDLGSLIPGAAGDVLHFLSFKEHYASFQRGLIDTRDIIFFLSCATLALMLAFRSLESRKWN
jgi:ABC-2 type transport system permease protein